MPNMSESGGTQIAPEAPKYKYDRVRLETFQSWPANAKVEAWKMARAGLRYTGEGEEVHCSWCDCPHAATASAARTCSPTRA